VNAKARASSRVARWADRVVCALVGGGIAMVGLALFEVAAAPTKGPAMLAELSVLAVPFFSALFTLGTLWWLLEPDEVEPAWRRVSLALASEEPLLRSQTAAFLPLLVLFGTVNFVVLAHLARILFGLPKAAPSMWIGVVVGGVTVLSLVVVVVAASAVATLLRRLLAQLASALPFAIDPRATGVLGVCVAGLLIARGIHIGDTSGDGGFWAILGVLKRRELDLQPLAHLAGWLLASYCIALLLIQLSWRSRALFGFVFWLAASGLAYRGAHQMTADDAAALDGAKLGKPMLGVMRRLFDRDHDGFSNLYAGGDCNDRDPKISPTAVEVPGNGIDEDCSGADTPKVESLPKAVAQAPVALSIPAGGYNIVLVTVDTLRHDLGFAGNPRPVSPNLDALAAKSIVYERAYSLASYTGKSIGPLIIGKYPSETLRDGSHFNTYLPGNVTLGERMRELGKKTVGVTSLWYFGPASGLGQGFDTWDLSPKPPGGGDKDNYTTSDKITNAALGHLAKLPKEGGFHMWLHYFDPHAEYLAHEGSPNFAADPSGKIGPVRAQYEQEVWYTDRELGRFLDALAASPFASNTVICVTSDHGEAFGDHGMSFHGREIWESLVRVPLVIYVPGLKAKRIREKRSHIDLTPTLFELGGGNLARVQEQFSGASLANELASGEPPAEKDVYIDMPLGPYNGLRRGFLTGKSPGQKLIHYGGAQMQLFDLAQDPEEANDLAKDKTKLGEVADRMARFRAGLKEFEVKPVP
jgi:choline-sulfatase